MSRLRRDQNDTGGKIVGPKCPLGLSDENRELTPCPPLFLREGELGGEFGRNMSDSPPYGGHIRPTEIFLPPVAELRMTH